LPLTTVECRAAPDFWANFEEFFVNRLNFPRAALLLALARVEC